jgi:hypothetical protein
VGNVRFTAFLVCVAFTQLAHAEPEPPSATSLPLRLDDLSAAGVRRVESPSAPAKTRRRVSADALPADARRLEAMLRGGGELWIEGTRARLILEPGERVRAVGDLGNRSEEVRRALLFGGQLRVDEHTLLTLRDERAVEAHVTVDGKTFVLIAPSGSTLRVVGLYVETTEPVETRPIPRPRPLPLPRMVITEPAPAPPAPARPAPVQPSRRRQVPEPSIGLWDSLQLEYEKLAELDAELRALRAARDALSADALPTRELLEVDARISALQLDVQVLWQRASHVIAQLGRPVHDRQRLVAEAARRRLVRVSTLREVRREFDQVSRSAPRNEATRERQY